MHKSIIYTDNYVTNVDAHTTSNNSPRRKSVNQLTNTGSNKLRQSTTPSNETFQECDKTLKSPIDTHHDNAKTNVTTGVNTPPTSSSNKSTIQKKVYNDAIRYLKQNNAPTNDCYVSIPSNTNTTVSYNNVLGMPTTIYGERKKINMDSTNAILKIKNRNLNSTINTTSQLLSSPLVQNSKCTFKSIVYPSALEDMTVFDTNSTTSPPQSSSQHVNVTPVTTKTPSLNLPTPQKVTYAQMVRQQLMPIHQTSDVSSTRTKTTQTNPYHDDTWSYMDFPMVDPYLSTDISNKYNMSVKGNRPITNEDVNAQYASYADEKTKEIYAVTATHIGNDVPTEDENNIAAVDTLTIKTTVPTTTSLPPSFPSPDDNDTQQPRFQPSRVGHYEEPIQLLVRQHEKKVEESLILLETVSDTTTHAVTNETKDSINYFTNFAFDYDKDPDTTAFTIYPTTLPLQDRDNTETITDTRKNNVLPPKGNIDTITIRYNKSITTVNSDTLTKASINDSDHRINVKNITLGIDNNIISNGNGKMIKTLYSDMTNTDTKTGEHIQITDTTNHRNRRMINRSKENRPSPMKDEQNHKMVTSENIIVQSTTTPTTANHIDSENSNNENISNTPNVLLLTEDEAHFRINTPEVTKIKCTPSSDASVSYHVISQHIQSNNNLQTEISSCNAAVNDALGKPPQSNTIMDNTEHAHIRLGTKNNVYTTHTNNINRKLTNVKHTTHCTVHTDKAKQLAQIHDGEESISHIDTKESTNTTHVRDDRRDDTESPVTPYITIERIEVNTSRESVATVSLGYVPQSEDDKQADTTGYTTSTVTKDRNTLSNASANDQHYYSSYISDSNTHHTTTCSQVDVQSGTPDDMVGKATKAPSRSPLIGPYNINDTDDVNAVTTDNSKSNSAYIFPNNNSLPIIK